MQILLDLGLIALGLVLLVMGANWLVTGAVRLSLRLGLSASLVGATVVAFGTSAPELILSVTAALKGPEGVKLAVGTIIGSNICNILLILGSAGAIKPLKADPELLKWDGPWLIAAALALASVIWLPVLFASQGSAGDPAGEFVITGFEGGVLFGLFLLFILTAIWRAKRSRRAEPSPEVAQELVAVASRHWGVDSLLLLAGLVGLAAGSESLVRGASSLATQLGVDAAIVGLTIVAFGTSLPELATSVMAARKGEADIAISNVTGSNIQNILLCLGASAIVFGLFAEGSMPVQELFATWDLAIMGAVTLVLVGFLALDGRVTRARALFLLACYGGFVSYLFATQAQRG